MKDHGKACADSVRGEGAQSADSSPVVDTPEAISRWEAFGGTWEVAEVQADRAIVELRRCDGGEVVESLASDDPAFVRWAAVQRARSG